MKSLLDENVDADDLEDMISDLAVKKAVNDLFLIYVRILDIDPLVAREKIIELLQGV